MSVVVENRRIECQIADHMAWELQNHGFAESLYGVGETDPKKLRPVYDARGTVVRTYIPEYDIEGSESPRVSVSPFGFEQSRETRVHFRELYTIDIVTHQRLVGAPPDRNMSEEDRQRSWRSMITKYGDHVTKISEQIRMYFEPRGMDGAKIEGCPGCKCAAWMNVAGSPIYEEAMVDERHIVLCVQRHTWLTIRKRCGCG